MTESGRSQVLKSIEGLQPLDCTNLWDGLKVGMDLLKDASLEPQLSEVQKPGLFTLLRSGKKAQSKVTLPSNDVPLSSERFSTLFILTDGMPNINPPRGHIPVLKAYLNALDNSHTFNINTFGFGYSLDSKLLLEISQVGGGGYAFIPDSGIVGTVFVNAVANAYATYAPRVRLDVEIPDGNTVDVKGDLAVTKTSWGVQIAAGDLQFGQTMDIVLLFSNAPEDITATLNYRPSTANEDCKVHTTMSKNDAPQLAPIKYHAARLEFVKILQSISRSDLPSSLNLLETLANRITQSPILANHTDALALEKDISGEGKLALEPANFNRWGKHYLPSLARSHQRQQCGNFKDPGLQVYCRDSKIFVEERNRLDAAFMALPPPKPSVRQYNPSNGKSVPARKLGSMSSYYRASGPCFTGDCLVRLSGGRYMRVDELKRGIEVQTLAGTNKIAAVMRTGIPSREALLCRIGNLKITPWHPIVSPLQKGSWVFPANIASPEPMACEAVYSVLLLPAKDDAGSPGDPDVHSISIAGVWCVTLGHGLTRTGHPDVRVHSFLGDYERVLREFSASEGFFGDGVVECVGTKRDPLDGTICGFVVDRVDKRAEWIAPTSALCI
jgi:hypothetical protein